MYDRNPGEIDFGSSQREVRVSEGSSYRESTVFTKLLIRTCDKNLKMYYHKSTKSRKILKAENDKIN